MALAIDPAALQVPAAGGVSTHTLTNSGESRLAFKVKSTNNDHYRLKPVFGFVEPGQTATIEVTRTAGPPKEDKLIIQFLEVAADVTEAAELFKSGAPQEITLPASAQ